MQVKFILGTDYKDLEDETNKFISTLTEDPTTIKYDFDKLITVIEYKKVEGKHLCCDCRFWDDNGDNLIGLCQRCGGRKRFSDKSCNKFEDIRG